MIGKKDLIKMQKEYGPDTKIGKMLHMSRQAVHQARNKYGIKPIPNHHKERNGKIVKAYNKGKTGIEIAREFNLSVSQAYRIIKKRS